MPNDAKLGLLVGSVGVLLAAVMIGPKSVTPPPVAASPPAKEAVAKEAPAAVPARTEGPTSKTPSMPNSYAGKKRHLPWYLLAAKCLAGSGTRILLHGGGAHTAGRLYTEQLLQTLDIPMLSLLRDTQNYAHLAAHGLSLWDVAAHKVEKDLVQWTPVLKWLGQA